MNAPLTHPTEDLQLRRRVRLLYASARTIAAQILGHRSDCSWGRTDLAHEAIKRMLEGSWSDRVRHRPEDTIRILRTVIHRTLIDYERTRRCRRRGSSLRAAHEGDTDGLPSHRAEAELEAAVQHAWVLERLRRGGTELALARPEAVVEVAELCLLLGLSQRDVSQHTGIPQTTVSHWMRMIRAWLRHELAAPGGHGAPESDVPRSTPSRQQGCMG